MKKLIINYQTVKDGPVYFISLSYEGIVLVEHIEDFIKKTIPEAVKAWY